MKDDKIVFSLLLKAGGVILGLLILLSLFSGGLFLPAAFQALSTIFMISLGILFLLIFIPFLVITIMGKDVTLSGGSSLVKDGVLRYEYYEDGKKKRKNVNIENIDKYLNEFKKMNLFDDIVLIKDDYSKKANANNLLIEYKGQKISLSKLNKDNKNLYNRLVQFFDSISDKDIAALQFRLKSFVEKDVLLNQGRDVVKQLQELDRQIKDEDIKIQIDEVIHNIRNNESKIDNDYQIRRLYENYLGMLVEICKNYAVLEKHKTDENSLINTRKNLMETLMLINTAFKKIKNLEDEEEESEVKTIEEVLNQKQ